MPFSAPSHGPGCRAHAVGPLVPAATVALQTRQVKGAASGVRGGRGAGEGRGGGRRCRQHHPHPHPHPHTHPRHRHDTCRGGARAATLGSRSRLPPPQGRPPQWMGRARHGGERKAGHLGDRPQACTPARQEEVGAAMREAVGSDGRRRGSRGDGRRRGRRLGRRDTAPCRPQRAPEPHTKLNTECVQYI